MACLWCPSREIQKLNLAHEDVRHVSQEYVDGHLQQLEPEPNLCLASQPESLQLDSSSEPAEAFAPGIVDACTHWVGESILNIATSLSNAKWCAASALELVLACVGLAAATANAAVSGAGVSALEAVAQRRDVEIGDGEGAVSGDEDEEVQDYFEQFLEGDSEENPTASPRSVGRLRGRTGPSRT
ncbi:unnamed protein product [Prorocentrum cordatum]|uniref:Uncharacterized protein n=1 Tax=Prorocentrum cordatum TaxID=2364126 RepID=A0ABN9X1X5_9DINO|nr:unnamed protein product [Polarella glacialis]